MKDLNELLKKVDADRLVAHVEEITRYVRLSGNDEDYKAFEYIKSVLESFGLNPVMERSRAYISLPLKAELTVGSESIPCTTHSMLPSAELTSDIVYIADSAHIEGLNLAGKIVMTDGLAMYPVMKSAEKAGAAAMIFIAGSVHVHEMIVSTVWGSPEPSDLDRYISIPAVSVAYDDGEHIKELLKTNTHARIVTEVSKEWVDLPLLTADIAGAAPEYLILTSHVDSWHHGAMDNASGNAAALEIANILSKEKLKRSIKVVFWSGHSHGRYAGSAAFCDAYFNDLYENCFLHINADCLGGACASLLSQGGCTAETYALGAKAIKTVTGEDYEGTRFTRSCDQSFWGTGTPSLFSNVSEQPKPESEDAASKAFAILFGGSKSGGYGWWWHTVADTCDKIDPALLKRDTQIFLGAVYEACISENLPIDIIAGFNEFADLMENYNALGSEILHFKPVIEDIRRVQKQLEAVNITDRFIIAFEQLLIPLRYVKKDQFQHDSAAKQMPLPLLEELHTIHALSGDEYEATVVMLRRRLNKIHKGIRDILRLFGA